MPAKKFLMLLKVKFEAGFRTLRRSRRYLIKLKTSQSLFLKRTATYQAYNVVVLCQVLRVVRGTGDTWDSRARARGVPASSSLNGIGLVPDEPPDLYQENEELKVHCTTVYIFFKYT